jgi:hypothetical protein
MVGAAHLLLPALGGGGAQALSVQEGMCDRSDDRRCDFSSCRKYSAPRTHSILLCTHLALG